MNYLNAPAHALGARTRRRNWAPTALINAYTYSQLITSGLTGCLAGVA